MTDWLIRFSEMDGAIVRPVDLRGEAAWAFTPPFRAILREAGLPLTLRALPEA
jgi:hypothetical protein